MPTGRYSADVKANANYTWNHSEQKSGVNKGYALNDYPRHMANLSLDSPATQVGGRSEYGELPQQ